MASSLKDYLKRYTSSGDAAVDTKKGKSKKKRKTKGMTGGDSVGGGVLIVDDDALWQKEEKLDDEDEPIEEGDKPVVLEDVEVKRMQKMEALSVYRPYLSVGNDGSGWVTVREDEMEAASAVKRRQYGSDHSPSRSSGGQSPDLPAKRKRSDSPDLSPPRRRHDSPDDVPGRMEKPSSRITNLSEGSRIRNDAEHLAPPRKRRDSSDSPDLSPERRRHDSPDAAVERRLAPADLSSRRRSKFSTSRNDSADLSPPRNRRDSPDLSPPRRRRDLPDTAFERRSAPADLSLPRRSKFSTSRNDSADLSPPRKRRDSPDLSPPRRRHDSPDAAFERRSAPADLSPPRRSKFSTSRNEALSPPRKRRNSPEISSPTTRHRSPDVASPRKGSEDSSPLWKRRASPDLASGRRGISRDSSPPRRSKLSAAPPSWKNSQDFARDLSPPRRRKDSPDISPPRRRQHSPVVALGRSVISEDSSPPRKSKFSAAAPKRDQSQDLSPPRKKPSGRMADGASAGLRSDGEVAAEAERKRAAEATMLATLDPSASGRGAETVFRDKRGRRLEGLEEMLRQQKGEAKAPEQPLEWGKGLAQKKEAAASAAELEAEKSKPFARYRDDEELDKSLKERLRWGDPMAHLVKRKTTEPILEDLGAREEMKSSGFIVPQEIPKHSWLKRGTAPPPNRYEIRPGRHWDGVDRSTGFEQGLFKSKNEKKARDLEAYLWSVSDM